uniref:NERD domain-containing protein n=1 Tax=Arundo donax TaxID=35708 RepID=A0A0A8ZCA0_ARUDO
MLDGKSNIRMTLDFIIIIEKAERYIDAKQLAGSILFI